MEVRYLIVTVIFQATKDTFTFIWDCFVEVITADAKTAHIVIFFIAVGPPLQTRHSKVSHLIDSFSVSDHVKASNGDTALFDSFQGVSNCRYIQRDFPTGKGKRADISSLLKAVEKSIDVLLLNIDAFGISAQAVRTAHIAPARNFYEYVVCAINTHFFYALSVILPRNPRSRP